MDGYLTVDGISTSLYEDRKSRFFGFVTRIESEEEVVAFRSDIKEDIPEASHYVSAYRIHRTGVDHYSDAKEPHGTAGMPVLNVLVHHGLQDVVCVVARIFGGTLLGKGGLMRAYTQAAADAVAAATIVRCVPCRELRIRVDYQQYDALLAQLSLLGVNPDDTAYAENVTITATVPSSEAEVIGRRIEDFCHGRALVELGAERMGTVSNA